jgi:hypothetical protein
MRHDGRADLNECDPGGYLMSPTLSGTKNTWSTCSNKYLKKFLRFFQSSSLTIIIMLIMIIMMIMLIMQQQILEKVSQVFSELSSHKHSLNTE